MYIKDLKIVNYKSFLAPRGLQFGPGFNVVVGQNNVGKTALVETLSQHFRRKEHRSLETFSVSDSDSPGVVPSQVDINFTWNRKEVIARLSRQETFYLPLPIRDRDDPFIDPADPAKIVNLFNEVVSKDTLTVVGTFVADREPVAHIAEYSGQEMRNAREAIECRWNATTNRIEMVNAERRDIPPEAHLPARLAALARERTYVFRAERFNIGISPSGAEDILMPDATNLPQVLHYLSTSNPSVYERLMHYVRVVTPQIQGITVPPVSGSNKVESCIICKKGWLMSPRQGIVDKSRKGHPLPW